MRKSIVSLVFFSLLSGLSISQDQSSAPGAGDPDATFVFNGGTGGGGAAYLKNQNGVVIKLLATQIGLRFTLAGEGVKVNLKG
jgi:hypothetical protein